MLTGTLGILIGRILERYRSILKAFIDVSVTKTIIFLSNDTFTSSRVDYILLFLTY